MPTQQTAYLDFRAIKAQVSIDQVLKHYGLGEGFKGAGAQRRGPCPLHDHAGANKRPFNVNVRKNVWYCFGEGEGGNVIDLVAALEGCSPRQAAEKLSDWFTIQPAQKPGRKPQAKQRAHRPAKPRAGKRKKDAGAPDPCVEGAADASQVNPPLTFAALKHLDCAHETVMACGLTAETAERFGAGYCTRGIMRGRIAVPIHNTDGDLVAYAGIDPEDVSAPYRWPKGFRPEWEVFNAHRLAERQAVLEEALIVVDDVLSVFALYEAGWENAVALIGGGVSPRQLATLERLLEPVKTPRILWAFRREAADDQPPYETLGRLSDIAWVRALPLAAL